MKINILVPAVFLLCFGTSYSQVIKNIGFKTGITFSAQKWEDSDLSFNYDFNTAIGMYNVITCDFMDRKFLQLSADFGYYQSTSKPEINDFAPMINSLSPKTNIKFGFVTLSPVLKFKIPLVSFTPYIFIAPRIDYYSQGISNDSANLYKNYINKTAWGFNIGEGLSYQLKNFTFYAEYQFLYSFNYLRDMPAVYANYAIERDRIKINTHVISIGIKYSFIRSDNPLPIINQNL